MAGGSHKRNSVRARKDERKAKRRGGPSGSDGPRDDGRGKRRAEPQPESEEEEERPRKKAKEAEKPAKAKPSKSKPESEVSEKKDKGKGKDEGKKKSKELVLPEDDKDVEDREIKWLEYMLKNEAGEDSDGLDGELSLEGGMRADSRYSGFRGQVGAGWQGDYAGRLER